VQTEYVAKWAPSWQTRRRRSPAEPQIWAAHHAVVEGEALGKPVIRDRQSPVSRRGRGIRGPVAGVGRPAFVQYGRTPPFGHGFVLDPVSCCGSACGVPAGASVHVAFWTSTASSGESALDLVDKHHEPNAFVRASTLAWTQAQVQLRHLGIDAAEASLFQRLAGHVLFADASMRPSSDTIGRGGGGRRRCGSRISGDLPIVLLGSMMSKTSGIARQLCPGSRILADEAAGRRSRRS